MDANRRSRSIAGWASGELPTADELVGWVIDARERTFELVDDLEDDQLMGPQLGIINPLIWEIGHVAWFQERWVLRHAGGEAPIRDDADELYDSIAIAHDRRWSLPLPSRQETYGYMRAVRDRVVELLQADADEELRYFVAYAVFHEDMHDEAFTYTRQTLGYPAPPISIGAGSPAPDPGGACGGGTGAAEPCLDGGPLPGDVEVPGGRFLLGASPQEAFVFDNEKWAHAVEVEPFAIARAPVTQAEFAAFVEDGGYRHRELWSEAGWSWRQRAAAEHPVYWKLEGGRWLCRHFDRWLPLAPHRPVIHVNWYEADAYCRWAGRRLPTEAEWEMAAAGLGAGDGGPSPEVAGRKRRYPWGDEPPDPGRANLEWRAMGTLDVGALAGGDSACGCRQMIGNVWEWTASDFLPYPGFVPDPYKEYSQPWFGDRKVLRGGCWVTRGRMLRNTWRNFYTPDRRDVFAGFRTCALRD